MGMRYFARRLFFFLHFFFFPARALRLLFSSFLALVRAPNCSSSVVSSRRSESRSCFLLRVVVVAASKTFVSLLSLSASNTAATGRARERQNQKKSGKAKGQGGGRGSVVVALSFIFVGRPGRFIFRSSSPSFRRFLSLPLLLGRYVPPLPSQKTYPSSLSLSSLFSLLLSLFSLLLSLSFSFSLSDDDRRGGA